METPRGLIEQLIYTLQYGNLYDLLSVLSAIIVVTLLVLVTFILIFLKPLDGTGQGGEEEERKYRDSR